MSILEMVTSNFPGHAFKKARFLGEGMDNKAYLVDDWVIFRFPKNEEVARNLAKEIAVLPHLQHLPLAVPDFRFVGKHPGTGLHFVGYPKLEGVEWSGELFSRQTAENQNRSLALIGNFLTKLHHFKVETAGQLGVETVDSYRDYQTTYQEIRSEWFPLLPTTQQNRISQRFESFLSDPRHFLYSPALIHDDFSSDHILCDPATGLPVSVIDFGDIAIGDPDLDFKYLYEEVGQSFIERLLIDGYYHTPTDQKVLMEKLAFFSLCERIMDLLESGQEQPERVIAELEWVL